MDFTVLKSQRIMSPPLIVIMGGPGIGKTSFTIGASAASNYMIGKDDHFLINIDYKAADRLQCKRGSDLLGRPISCYDDIKKIFKALAESDHDLKWVGFDDLSVLETIFVNEVCEENGVSAIDKIEYGRGYELARAKWFSFFDCIEQLQQFKNVGIILIAHTTIENRKDPLTEAYGRHVLLLDKRSAAIVREKVELIGFAHKNVLTAEIDKSFGKKTNVAVGKATRVLSFAPDIEGFESKDRFSLPEEIPLDWDIFETELNKSLGLKSEELKETKKEKK